MDVISEQVQAGLVLFFVLVGLKCVQFKDKVKVEHDVHDVQDECLLLKVEDDAGHFLSRTSRLNSAGWF